MDNFDEYKFADIPTNENNKLTELENEIKSKTGKDVVLIAYEKDKMM